MLGRIALCDSAQSQFATAGGIATGIGKFVASGFLPWHRFGVGSTVNAEPYAPPPPQRVGGVRGLGADQDAEGQPPPPVRALRSHASARRAFEPSLKLSVTRPLPAVGTLVGATGVFGETVS